MKKTKQKLIPVRLESWTSSDNSEEVHFFIKGSATYVFGFNPAHMTRTQADLILNTLGFEAAE